MVLPNNARGKTYLVQAELTASSPRNVSLEYFMNLYEVLDNLHTAFLTAAAIFIYILP
jgi:hypothetical protein